MVQYCRGRTLKGVILLDILSRFRYIMAEESKLNNWVIPSAEEIFNTVEQIKEFAYAGTVMRSYNRRYGLTDNTISYESDGAHTNLMAAIVDRALLYQDTPHVFIPNEYTYREIMEAVRRHDLPENISGDVPDNGDRDELAKRTFERSFQDTFSKKTQPIHCATEQKIIQLLREMDNKSSATGKLIYVADKVSALIITLCYDSIGYSPMLKLSDPSLSQRDKNEMSTCDNIIDNACLASEMWTIDYFKERRIVQYDETGFLTAIVIMYTLQVHDYWYSWREQEYSESYKELINNHK